MHQVGQCIELASWPVPETAKLPTITLTAFGRWLVVCRLNHSVSNQRSQFNPVCLFAQASVGLCGCSLYRGDDREHAEFAIQLCNEKLRGKQQRQDGRMEYWWKTAEPHDYLDAMAMCHAVAGSQGISPGMNGKASVRERRRPRVRIV